MRVIKLKGYCEFCNGFDPLKNCYFDRIGNLNVKCKICNSDLIIMQYTGLKDKNGKEIYEGDIINPKDNNLKKVFWSDVYAQYWCEDYDGKTIPLATIKEYELEVVGNIYENSELMTEGRGES